MAWVEAAFYAFLYAYASLGIGYFAKKIHLAYLDLEY